MQEYFNPGFRNHLIAGDRYPYPCINGVEGISSTPISEQSHRADHPLSPDYLVYHGCPQRWLSAIAASCQDLLPVGPYYFERSPDRKRQLYGSLEERLVRIFLSCYNGR